MLGQAARSIIGSQERHTGLQLFVYMCYVQWTTNERYHIHFETFTVDCCLPSRLLSLHLVSYDGMICDTAAALQNLISSLH